VLVYQFFHQNYNYFKLNLVLKQD